MNTEPIFRDGDNSPNAVVASFTDISERKQAEEKIHQLNAQLEMRVSQRTSDLEASNKELESFAYSVSHDLRAPLRAVNGFAQALEDDFGGVIADDGRGYIKRIKEASRRMGLLIDDLLRLSRVARSSMRREAVDLSAMATRIIEEFRRQEPGRIVNASIASGLIVEGDAHLLKVGLENLLSNAWKFTAKEQETRLEMAAESRNGEQVFWIRDNGAGFDMRYSDKLFGAFERLHKFDEFEGTGIGLATVKRIVERHGGRVWGEGRPGGGATFYFTLSRNGGIREEN